MAKAFTCRLGVVQISFNPAYADELVACIQEPSFPRENEKIGLFTISGIEEIAHLQQDIAERYIAHLNRKIESVVRFASVEGVELLVFPEYSIPPESLPLCHALSEELGMILIAGSHVITISRSAQQVYRELDLKFEEGTKSAEERVRQAACIVFAPGQKPLASVKYVSSKWEACLVKGAESSHTFQVKTSKGPLELQILICIEALEGKQPKEKHAMPHLTVIPAFTPRVEPFYDAGRRALMQGQCTLFANVAEFGGSRVFARADNASLWWTEKDGSKPIPKHSEALLIIEADLEKQFEIRQSTKEHTAVQDLRLYPLLYLADSSEAQQYSDIRNICESTYPTLQEIGAQVSPFTNLNLKVFPTLLQDKLAHFTGHIAPAGTISIDEAIKWITPIAIRDTPSTDGLRWDLCSQSMGTVNSLQVSGRYVHKAEELMKVYLHLVERQNALASSIQPRQKSSEESEKLKQTIPSASRESPFIDRDSAFDRIRQFFNQQQDSIFILGGMRGIGKTALVREAFRQAIPPRKRIELQLTEGISYLRLLAMLASQCNLRIPENLNLTKPSTQQDLRTRILTYLGQGPGAVVVLDDFQFLLNQSAEIDDVSVKELLLALADAGQRGRSRYFFISHISPKLGPEFENYCARFTLQGLQPRDTERLLIQWLQFGRDDLAGQLPTPSERLISILGGHPLGTKIAASLWAEHPTTDIAEEFAIFKELRDTIVTFILEKLTLSPDERELLAFASIFRLPAPREVFLKWRQDNASYLLGSLVGHYLIETSDKGYQLHPLIRSFFSHTLSPDQSKALHKIAAKFYLEEFDRIKKSSKQIEPEFLGEAVHHSLAAGDRTKVKDLAFYAQELRPVALEHYRNGEQKVALKDYEVLLELDQNDFDAHFHLSLIFAKMNRWSDAEFHFGKAILLKPKAYWILQGFGAAKIRGNKVAEGEALLRQAEEINPHHSPTLVELGKLYERQGDPIAAEDYYRRAIDADRNNAFAYYTLARLLYHQDEIQQAFAMITTAVAINPTNDRNRAFFDQLKKKLAEAPPPTKEKTITAVRIRCIEAENATNATKNVTAVGGVNSDGKKWKITASVVISYIEDRKFMFFIETSQGRRADVVVAKDNSGRKYLKTTADNDLPDSLLGLPQCPPT